MFKVPSYSLGKRSFVDFAGTIKQSRWSLTNCVHSAVLLFKMSPQHVRSQSTGWFSGKHLLKIVENIVPDTLVMDWATITTACPIGTSVESPVWVSDTYRVLLWYQTKTIETCSWVVSGRFPMQLCIRFVVSTRLWNRHRISESLDFVRHGSTLGILCYSDSGDLASNDSALSADHTCKRWTTQILPSSICQNQPTKWPSHLPH